MKKIILALIAFLTLCSCTKEAETVTAAAPAEVTTAITEPVPEAARESDFRYYNYSGKISIKEYNGDEEILIIPDTIEGCPVSSIDVRFLEGTDVRELILPSSITEINGFSECGSLETIHIPSSLEKLGGFRFCDELKTIKAEEGGVYKDIDGVLFTADGKTLVAYPKGRDEKAYTVPDGVEIIESYAFSASGLSEIKLPESLKTIGKHAFYECKNLNKITVPDSVLDIGASAFENTPISSISLPESIKSIGGYAFRGTKLTELYLPDSVEECGFGVVDDTVKISASFPTEELVRLERDCFVEWRDETYLDRALRMLPEAEYYINGRIFIDLNDDNFPEMLEISGAGAVLACYDDDKRDWIYHYDYWHGYTFENGGRAYLCYNKAKGCYVLYSDISNYYEGYPEEYYPPLLFQTRIFIRSNGFELTYLYDEETVLIKEENVIETYDFGSYISGYEVDEYQKYTVITEKFADKPYGEIKEDEPFKWNGGEISEFPYVDIYYPDNIRLKICGKDILRGEEYEGVSYKDGVLYFNNAVLEGGAKSSVYCTGISPLSVELSGESEIICSQPFNLDDIESLCFKGEGTLRLPQLRADMVYLSENAHIIVNEDETVYEDTEIEHLFLSDNSSFKCGYITSECITLTENAYLFATKCECTEINLHDFSSMDIIRNKTGEGDYRGGSALTYCLYIDIEDNARLYVSNIKNDTIFCYPNGARISVSGNGVLEVDGNNTGIGISLEDSAFGKLIIRDNGTVKVRGSNVCVFAQAVRIFGGTLICESAGTKSVCIDTSISPYADFVCEFGVYGEVISGDPYEMIRYDYSDVVGLDGKPLKEFSISVRQTEEEISE